MADRPWRCSQCGTTNEPVANSCRTCGKWPSLFDLEDNAVEDEDFEPLAAPEPEPVVTYEPPPEPMTVEAPTFEEPPAEPASPSRTFGPPPTEPVFEEGEGQRRAWLSWLVPLAFVVYVAISYFFSSR
jgi:hypothetical protein